MEFVARPREEFYGKTVGIATVAPYVAVVVAVAVEYDVVSSVLELGVAGVFAVIAFAEALLQAGVAVIVEYALFYDAETAFQFEGVVGGIAKFYAAIVPIIGAYLVHDAAVVFGNIFDFSFEAVEVEYGSLALGGKEAYTCIFGTCLLYVDGCVGLIGSSVYPYGVAGHDDGYDFCQRGKWLRLCAVIAVVAIGGKM